MCRSQVLRVRAGCTGRYATPQYICSHQSDLILQWQWFNDAHCNGRLFTYTVSEQFLEFRISRWLLFSCKLNAVPLTAMGAGRRFELLTFSLWGWRATRLLHSAIYKLAVHFTPFTTASLFLSYVEKVLPPWLNTFLSRIVPQLRSTNYLLLY